MSDFDPDEEFNSALRETGFWGRAGSGCLLYAKQTGRFLIGLRSEDVLEPLTWGTWGGAIPSGMTPEESALVELFEETMFDGEAEMIHAYRFVDEASGFVYDNYIAIVENEFEPQLNWENCDYGWFEHGEFPDPLHRGLKTLLDNVPDLVALVENRKPAF
ncbi:NUDIX hydrolase [Mesorhizobium sp. SP-1A]|uniref:NUDIX hydrolase n=1 Tax=Mesorhizobium sp. SP-1A TaxID=3077840 RepID=UPI0028F7340B|nr:NUDIX hydrolase [Mesorhizobium sp. SP-1A]